MQARASGKRPACNGVCINRNATPALCFDREVTVAASSATWHQCSLQPRAEETPVLLLRDDPETWRPQGQKFNMQRSNPWALLSQQRFQHTEGQKAEMKQAASSGPQTTAQRWYQPKRIPLYIAVAGGLLGAATFFWTKQATHPQVETSKHIRYNRLS